MTSTSFSFIEFIQIKKKNSWLERGNFGISSSLKQSSSFFNKTFYISDKNHAGLLLHEMAHAIDFSMKGMIYKLNYEDFGLKFSRQYNNFINAMLLEARVFAIQRHLFEMLDLDSFNEMDIWYFTNMYGSKEDQLDKFAKNTIDNVMKDQYTVTYNDTEIKDADGNLVDKLSTPIIYYNEDTISEFKQTFEKEYSNLNKEDILKHWDEVCNYIN